MNWTAVRLERPSPNQKRRRIRRREWRLAKAWLYRELQRDAEC
jgi:hypothetical protein